MDNYIIERVALYYFLMQGLNEESDKLWKFVLSCFGQDENEAYSYKGIVLNPTLFDLQTVEDILIYKNYVEGFGKESEYGKDKLEAQTIDIKLSALVILSEIFKGMQAKADRLKTLSHIYELNHTAAVLYALQILYSNKDGNELASKVLERELTIGKNSDAGLLLLGLDRKNSEKTLTELIELPDMALRPNMIQHLINIYDCGVKLTKIQSKKRIGFGD